MCRSVWICVMGMYMCAYVHVCVQMYAGICGANVVNVRCLHCSSSLSIYFLDYFYFMSIDWYFSYMYVLVRVLDPLELDLQTIVSCYVGAGN